MIPMVEFTDEQKKEIAKMLESRDYLLTADTCYNYMVETVQAKVNMGVCDPFTLTVAKDLRNGFRRQAFPQAPPAQPQKPEGAESESKPDE